MALTMLGNGVLIAQALNQLTAIYISAFGWRIYFAGLGIFWAAVGVLAFIIVKEPTRSTYVFMPKTADGPQPPRPFFLVMLCQNYWMLLHVPSIVWNVLGVVCRFWGYINLLMF